MNIIYGGSFNPPTLAHLHIIKTLLESFEKAKVVILPVGNDYSKPDLVSFEHRYKMLNLLIRPYESSVVISTLENKKGYIGTLKALEELNKDYDNLYFVIGSDHLESLKTWISYEKLLNKYPFIVMNRNKYMTKEEAENMFIDIKHQFIFIDFDMEISSTKIRKNINKHKNFMTKEVFEYIKKYKLYEVPNV